MLSKICILFAVVLALSAVAGTSHAEESLTAQPDKQSHIATVAALNTFTYVALRRNNLTKWQAMITSAAVTTFVGVAKEVFDSRVDTEDLRADGIGLGASLGIVFLVDWF